LRTLQPGAAPGQWAFSPDGATLAITEPKFQPPLLGTPLKNHIVLWDPAADKEMARFRLGPPPPEGFNPYLALPAYSPDGKTIAYWDGFPLAEKADPAIRFVDAANGEPLGAIHVHDSPPAKLAFSPDGKAIFLQFANRANQTFVDVYRVPVLKAPASREATP
jgi:hypothetical protein